MITNINNEFYNSSGDSFDKIPFESILPDLLMKYGVGTEVLEIGSGGGSLAFWLVQQGYQVSCIEPAQELVKQAERKGLKVYPITIQDFTTDHQFDNVVAISSLIHLSKAELPIQIQKIAQLLKPHGIFFVSFIEGKGEGLEDPTNVGKLRYFSKWNEKELDKLCSPYFELLENHKVYNKTMRYTFFLSVYAVKYTDTH